jgi:putative transposase
LVFVTKYRRYVFDGAAIKELRAIFAKVSAELRTCDGEDDHVHLLVEYPPTAAISPLVNSLNSALTNSA